MATSNRVTFSLPSELARDLRYLSRRLGCSQSALVVSLLSESVAFMRSTVQQVPESPTLEDEPRIRRLRGESIAHIQSVLGEFTSDLEALKGDAS